ncbi:WAS/WASL-interacting protein family member 3-like [Triticum urartu]|uniref:WAS/WASL-interacting protein family member 3-like n=1 Tax=Triticum urartu TaxID=4572 RepID=UPI0020439AFC|nr:WAS/WASL-interacting protein family member 3-like [Triticum urartu]
MYTRVISGFLQANLTTEDWNACSNIQYCLKFHAKLELLPQFSQKKSPRKKEKATRVPYPPRPEPPTTLPPRRSIHPRRRLDLRRHRPLLRRRRPGPGRIAASPPWPHRGAPVPAPSAAVRPRPSPRTCPRPRPARRRPSPPRTAAGRPRPAPHRRRPSPPAPHRGRPSPPPSRPRRPHPLPAPQLLVRWPWPRLRRSGAPLPALCYWLSGVAYLWSHRRQRHWSVISSLFDYFVYSRGDFVQEEWTGMNPPTEAEALTLLRHGNPGRKNFVAWFMEKGKDPNISMDDELRWVSMGFDPAVMTCKKYDVNGYRFHTKEHQNSRPDPKTINTGVYTPGQNLVDYYGRAQNIYEIKFHQLGRRHIYKTMPTVRPSA